MQLNNRVIWSEGMLLQQQHLQQQDRYLHRLIDLRCGRQFGYGVGFSKLTLDESLLAMGKVGLLACEGVMPDGTPFSLPIDDELPLPLDVREDARDTVVVLALPLRRPGVPEFGENGDMSLDERDYARYRRSEKVVWDSNAGSGESTLMELGKLSLRLAFADEVGEGYATLGVARVIERHADNRVALDVAYWPPCIDCRAAPRLAGFIDELAGLLHQRGDALARRLARPGVSGTAETTDFLLLQLINRVEPLFAHFGRTRGLHPEALFREVLQLAGELSGFMDHTRRPSTQPTYRHDALEPTFRPLMDDIRYALTRVMEPHAVAIGLDERKFGLRIGSVADVGLFKTAEFVLGAKADMSAEVLLSGLPEQLKIGPIEKIHDLINLQLPGIGLRALPTVPRQLPFHAGFSYFALDANDSLWPQLITSGCIALHAAGEFPGLELELWAIRH